VTGRRNRRVDWEGLAPVQLRPAPGFPGLTVSDDGTVYGSSGQPLKRHLSAGRLFIKGYRADDGRTWFTAVEVACTTFHGPRPSSDHTAQNLNGDIYDNRPENVAWIQQQTEE
jgi:hypothetical protein